MVFIRPTFDVPNCARGIPASPSRAHGMLVAHSNSSFKWRYTNWWMSHRYCSNSQVSPNGGVTSSMRDSEKSVVMFSLVSGAPRAWGCRVCASSPVGDTRSDSFSTPLRPPRSTPRSPELMSPASRRSNCLSTTLRNTSNLDCLRQLRNDLDFDKKPRVHQTLHLHPRGRRQPFLLVILQPQVGGLQQGIHVGRINGLFDDLAETGPMRGERAPYIAVGGAHLPGHIAGCHQSPVFIRRHRAGNIQGFVDQHGLGITEILLVGVEVEDPLDPRRRRLRFALAGSQPGRQRDPRNEECPAEHRFITPVSGVGRTQRGCAAHATSSAGRVAELPARSSAEPKSPAPDRPRSARSYPPRRPAMPMNRAGCANPPKCVRSTRAMADHRMLECHNSAWARTKNSPSRVECAAMTGPVRFPSRRRPRDLGPNAPLPYSS